MSLFTKNCPTCGETASTSENICRCGHIFEADTDSFATIEQSSQEEEVYESYLAARLEQARMAAEKAIALLSQDPMNKSRMAEANKANRELEAVNKEYAAQLSALEKGRSRVEKAGSPAEIGRARSHSEPEPGMRKLDMKEQNTPKLAAGPAAMAAENTKLSRSFSPPKIISLSSPAVSAAITNRKQVPAASIDRPRALTRARSGRPRLETNEATRARQAARQLIAERAEALAARRSHTGMPPRLREQANERAQQVMQAARRSSANISGNLAAAIEALDSKIGHPGKKPANLSGGTRECPNCTAPLATTASRCSCGYIVSVDSGSMPGLSLNPKDLPDFF